MFFNEEAKLKFISVVSEKETVHLHYKKIFSSSYDYEVKLNKDLAEFSKDEMQQLFNDIGGARHSSKITFMNLIKPYIKWAKDNGFDVSFDPNSDINYAGDSVAKFRGKMVFSPEHLEKYMTAVFGSADDETVGVIYRCCLWLAFCNVDLEDAMQLRSSDVDAKMMRVLVNGSEVPLYKESVRAFELAKNLTKFRVIRQNTDVEIFMDREDGTRLLRASKRNGVSKKEYDNTRMLTGEIARNIRFAYNEGRIITRVGYSSVKLSGIFYRAFLREQMGMEPNFQGIVDLEMAKYHTDNHLNYNSKKCRTLGNYKRDYEIWKLAYKMFEEDSRL